MSKVTICDICGDRIHESYDFHLEFETRYALRSDDNVSGYPQYGHICKDCCAIIKHTFDTNGGLLNGTES